MKSLWEERAGGYAKADPELAKLNGIGVSDADWAVTTQACGTIARPSGSGNAALFSGQAAIGMAYDSDALGRRVSYPVQLTNHDQHRW